MICDAAPGLKTGGKGEVRVSQSRPAMPMTFIPQHWALEYQPEQGVETWRRVRGMAVLTAALARMVAVMVENCMVRDGGLGLFA